MKPVVLQILIAALTLAGYDRALAWHASRTNLHLRKIVEAGSRAEDALVFVGDSRAQAALDLPELRRALRAQGAPDDVVNLSLNSTRIAWHSLIAREQARRWPRTRGVVLCFGINRMLEDHPDPDPGQWTGFDSVLVDVIGPGELDEFMPGGLIRHPIWSLKYGLGRCLAMVRYRSNLAQGVSNRLNALANPPRARTNAERFGYLEDMIELQRQSRAESQALLVQRRTGDGWRLNPWFDELRRELKAREIPLYLVELPVIQEDRNQVTQRPECREFRAWLTRLVEADGGRYIDLGQLPGVTDDHFPDEVHMDESAARIVSQAIGEALARILKAPRDPGSGADSKRPGTPD